MCSFKNIRQWIRKDFTPPPTGPGAERRKVAEVETDRDLQKPVQQLVCDVHEECLCPLPERAQGEPDEHWNQRLIVLQLQRFIGAQKRMVSMMGRVAWEHKRTSNSLVWLTVVLVAMTAVLIWLTIVLVRGGR
jgi:hypothetical protein